VAAIGPDSPIEPVTPTGLELLGESVWIEARDIVSSRNPLRHDPEKLAAALLDIARGRRSETAKPVVPARPPAMVQSAGTKSAA
jgi:hypothetical protein